MCYHCYLSVCTTVMSFTLVNAVCWGRGRREKVECLNGGGRIAREEDQQAHVDKKNCFNVLGHAERGCNVSVCMWVCMPILSILKRLKEVIFQMLLRIKRKCKATATRGKR